MKKRNEGYGFKSMKKKIAGMAIASLLGITALASCAEEAHDDMQVEEVVEETVEVEAEETTPEVVEETASSAENTEETADVEETAPSEETDEVSDTEEVVSDGTTDVEETTDVETVEETATPKVEETTEEITETEETTDVVETTPEVEETVEEEVVEEQPVEEAKDTTIEEIEEISYEHEVEMKGNARAPYFVIDGSINAFCVEPDAVHPSNGTGYNETTGNYNFDTIFVNASEMVDVDDEVLNRSIQFAIWNQITGNSYESAALAFIGTADVYNALLEDVDLDNYLVSYVVYKTEMTDGMGNAFQTLISASVEKKAEPTPEPKPEPTPSPEPTPEPAPEPTPSPEPTPAPQPEKPSKPEKVIEKEKETVIEKTVEKETVIKETVQTEKAQEWVASDVYTPQESEWVASDVYVPQTGDTSNIMFYAVLAFMASFSMIVIGRKNFM